MRRHVTSPAGRRPSSGVITKLAAGFASLLLVVATLPLFAAPGSGAVDLAGGNYICGDITTILATIRTLESAGDYTAHAANSTASGAYQYIDRTWQYWAGTTGIDTSRFPTAASATPADQDSAAAANVRDILTDHLGDVTAVPIVWYLPSAWNNPTAMDTVPAGNTLTPRQYQTKWMAVYLRLHTDTPTAQAVSCSETITADGTWALPAPRATLANAGITQPHHDYPAVDLMMPAGTPVFAITAGHVVRTTHFNANWWTAGCTTSTAAAGCATCGMGITLQSDNGLRHTYCHNSALYVNDGDTVVAGQHIADSGNTGRSGAPHLHLELHYDQLRRCPQSLIDALYNGQTPPNLANLPTSGCSF